MKQLETDMLVIGGGPAGCAAAIRAAFAGLKVTLVEKASFPRELPGEALHPDVDVLFAELDVLKEITRAGFIKYPGWMHVQNGDSHYIPFAIPPLFRFGYQAWRAKLDAILLGKARQSGVTIYHENSARKVLMDSNRVMGFETEQLRLVASHTIDASGQRRWLAKKLGLQSRKLSPDLVARYGYSNTDFGIGNVPVFSEHRYGWIWLAKVQDNFWQCVQLSLTPNKEIPSPPKHYGFPARLAGADVTWRLLHKSAGPGYFICGDAAASIDPAASRGVARALESGMKAADLAIDQQNGVKDEQDVITEYNHWLDQKIMTEAQVLARRHSSLKVSPEWLQQLSG